jgi:hypothetical protein
MTKRAIAALLGIVGAWTVTPALAEENIFFTCVPLHVNIFVALAKDENVDCRKDEKQEDCKTFRVDMYDLKASGGSYVYTDSSEDKDGDVTTQTLTISRVDGSYSQAIEMTDVRFTETGKCFLKKETLKY